MRRDPIDLIKTFEKMDEALKHKLKPRPRFAIDIARTVLDIVLRGVDKKLDDGILFLLAHEITTIKDYETFPWSLFRKYDSPFSLTNREERIRISKQLAESLYFTFHRYHIDLRDTYSGMQRIAFHDTLCAFERLINTLIRYAIYSKEDQALIDTCICYLDMDKMTEARNG